MNQLFYPTIDLFTYDLKSALNLKPEEIEQQRKDFLAKFPPEIRSNFHDSETETEYHPLFTDPTTGENEFDLKPHNPDLEGFYYPVQLNDVYGLQLDCSVDNLTEPQDINSFAEIKTEIENKTERNDLTIGQTWLVSGWLTEADQQNAEVIAQACYKSLFDSQEDWQQWLYSQGDFLNGKLFEVWQTESYPYLHVVILLFPNQAMAEEAAKYYKDWMGLFCYRHKITWAYQQSRSIKTGLISHYQKIEENTQIIKQNKYRDQNLTSTSTETRLNNIQDILDQYTFDLLNLTFQKQIIEINLFNYQKRVKLIKQKTGAENNLDGLNLFGNFVEEKYLAQINNDNENMQVGIKLLENNINAIRSKIELEKEERERTFQDVVTFIGTGMAGASLIKLDDTNCDTIFDPNSSICKTIGKTPILGDLVVPILLILILILLFGFLGWSVRNAIKKF